MANYVDQWLQLVVNQIEGKNRNLRLPTSGTVMAYGVSPFGGNLATSKSLYTQYANNLGNIKGQLSRGLTDAERNAYMEHYSSAVNSNSFIKGEFLPQWEREYQQKQQQEALQKQQEELARQKAEQERLRAEQEAKAREQQAALERQRQAAEKARKEAEFKSALDAMNQRANVKRTDEVVGEMSETPEQAAQRKKKRVGYDATKVTGILGAAPTESKKLLGM
jgi:membrane protein involved in colicin uptake